MWLSQIKTPEGWNQASCWRLSRPIPRLFVFYHLPFTSFLSFDSNYLPEANYCGATTIYTTRWHISNWNHIFFQTKLCSCETTIIASFKVHFLFHSGPFYFFLFKSFFELTTWDCGIIWAKSVIKKESFTHVAKNRQKRWHCWLKA